MEKKTDRRGLGRGLSALMADVNLGSDARDQGQTARPVLRVPVELLFPNPNQPRRDFEPVALQELADSIGQKGVIQPLIVRSREGMPGYEIVAGERRWRASQMAQLHDVPVLVREFSDSEVLEIAIIENIQRADLNAIEEALGFRQLIDRFGHTQEKLAEALSKSRSHITNQMRLLQLPDDVQVLLRTGKLSAGHARALITSPNASDLARQVVAKSLSVRETERLVKTRPAPDGSSAKARAPREEKDADTRALEADLSANLHMLVRIDHFAAGDGGQVTIRYKTLDDLDLLCRALSLVPRDMAT